MNPIARIESLTIWHGTPRAEPLEGGKTNLSFVVQDRHRRAVVRIGDDIGVHHVLRFNELAASQAAHAAGVSPAILHHEPGLMVMDFVDGKTLQPQDFADDAILGQALDLILRAHRDIPRHLRGPALSFWVFHVIRDYAASLADGRSAHLPLLPALLAQAAELEAMVGPIEMVFGHNDLLPGNFIHDGARLWLIDWDYAGFGSPLFDLGGLAANNALTPAQEAHLLGGYFGRAPDEALWRRYRAMKAAAALREALWSMVSEIHSPLAVDYAAYSATNLAVFRAAFEALKDFR